MSAAGIPDYAAFNEDKIAEYVQGKQANRNGQLVVACGDVAELKFADGQWSCFVHAEKTGNKWYLVKAKFGAGGEIVSTECCCKARRYAHTRCKHQAAILYILLARRNYAQNAQKPKWANRPSLKLMTKGMDAKELKEVRANWTWEEMLEVAQQPAPRHNEGELRRSYDLWCANN